MHQESAVKGRTVFCLLLFVYAQWTSTVVAAAGHHGQVMFSGLGVPGAIVTVSQGDMKHTAVTDDRGAYSFPELPEGLWAIRIDMQAFSPVEGEVTVGPDAAPGAWELRILPLDQIKGLQVQAPAASPAPKDPVAAAAGKPSKSKGSAATPTNTQTPFQRAEVNATGAAPQKPAEESLTAAAPNQGFGDQTDLSQRAADGFLISGTANNSSSSPFALRQAFGNARRSGRSLYSGNLGFVIDNSALDARAYSLSGMNTEKPAYNRMQGMVSFGGPIRIPRLVHNGPNFFINYQFARNRNARTESGLVPTRAEREGDLSQASGQILDPETQIPFENNQIPSERISPQARSLLELYPLPNFSGSTRYNYQVPVVGSTHTDNIVGNVNKSFGLKNQLMGMFGYQSNRSDNPTLLGFLDTNRTRGLNASASWRHRFSQRLYTSFGYQFNRQSMRTTPFFQNRANISGLAGIAGNDQDSSNWGPPTISFSSGLTSLSDALPASTRSQMNGMTVSSVWARERHTFSFGGEYRRQQTNLLSQQNPRGSFVFTGASTLGLSGSTLVPGVRNDFAGFLLGVPDTLSLAFGNADKYLRGSSLQAYLSDDWRVGPNLTLNLGVRWEYASPITEKYGRLVNLDIAPGFSAVAPVIANHPVGSLTGATYSDSLVDSTRYAFQPRLGFAWRPVAASSMVVRGGYGIYYNSSPYQSIAMLMVQQSPLSKSLSLQNTAENPLTLATGFNASPNTTANTFAVDPHLRIGYLHIWQLSFQQDLPFALQFTAAYQGTRGRHALQQFLPNTYPAGAQNPCPSCPSGFSFMTSNGMSLRESGTLQLRRRLRSGFTATAEYTFSKSIDDAAPGGNQTSAVFTAQNWMDLRAERALSSFDRRHQASVQFQYTSGMGIGGGTLLRGWRGALAKEWTLSSQINFSSGYPLTPVYPRAVTGTGVTGPVRPDFTGIDVQDAPRGIHLNAAAYAAPTPGHWGNAGRNSITGPSQFTMNASLARTFRTSDQTSLDLRVDAANALNHVTFPSWNTTVGSALFGLPLAANSMRTLQTTIRWRF